MKETYGVPVEEIQEGIKHGVRKINIDTDIRLAMTAAIRKFLHENPSEVRPARIPEARARGREGDLQAALRSSSAARARRAKIKPVPLPQIARDTSRGELRAGRPTEPARRAAAVGPAKDSDGAESAGVEAHPPRLPARPDAGRVRGLVVIGFATTLRWPRKSASMFSAARVTLADLLLMFLYLEVLAMIGQYFNSGQLPVRFPLYIAMVAMARYIILDIKDADRAAAMFARVGGHPAADDLARVW